MKRLFTGALLAGMVALAACSGTPTQSQETADSTLNSGSTTTDPNSSMRTDTSMMQTDSTRTDTTRRDSL